MQGLRPNRASSVTFQVKGRCLDRVADRVGTGQFQPERIVFFSVNMMQTFFLTRWCGAGLELILVTLATLSVSAAAPQRVLILNPFGRDAAPFSAGISAFRSALTGELGESVDCYEVPLDLASFGAAEGEGPFVAFLEGRIKSHPVDLVVPVGGAGVQFAARHRERLFPSQPILVFGAEPRMVPRDFLRTNATLVTQKVNLGLRQK